jgi:aspartyl/asparaginyl beta-hydroxylase (cupin superfamily)
VSEWYPVADTIFEARSLAMQIGKDLKALSMGAVLITRIPPGGQVYPHIDQGWHARHYEKFALQIRGDEKQAFHFQDEDLMTQDGDLFWFDNAYSHWVTNDSDQERITMIVCVRRMPCQ